MSSLCAHCQSTSEALSHKLLTTDNFYVVCDTHPLTEGHLLVIPKNHTACMGALTDDLFQEFLALYQKFSKFINDTYGVVSSFEHGIIGQTVFHAHTHILPYSGAIKSIVPEGIAYLRKLKNIKKIKDVYNKEGKYLFVSLGDNKWVVDLSLGRLRFFRDRFAVALGVPERGDWRELGRNETGMRAAAQDIKRLQAKWDKYKKRQSMY